MQRVRLRRYGHGGKKILAVALVTVLATLSSCTPKPAGAREAATDFAKQLSAMASSHDENGDANDDQPIDHADKAADKHHGLLEGTAGAGPQSQSERFFLVR